MKKRVAVLMFGLVQGVGFRFWVERQAKMFSIVGWVKNLYNGSVKIVAEGEEEDLQKLIDLCYTGSESTSVSNIKVKWRKYQKEFRRFEIRY